jgi:hypothetical protein
MGDIGDVFTHNDGIKITAGFTRVTWYVFQALYGRDRPILASGPGRNTRTVFYFFFGKIARYGRIMGHLTNLSS